MYEYDWMTPEWVSEAIVAERAAAAFITGRRGTKKTEFIIEYISGPQTKSCPIILGGPFKGQRGMRVFIVPKGEDPPNEAVLYVELEPEEIDLAQVKDVPFVVIHHAAAVWACPALGADKKSLELDTPIRNNELTHKDAAEFYSELVWVGPSNPNDQKASEEFGCRLVFLALEGIRGVIDPKKFGPGIFTPLQRPEYRLRDTHFTHWIWEILQRIRTEGIRTRGAFAADRAGSDELFGIKAEYVNFLRAKADDAYELQNLTPNWVDGELTHKDVRSAIDDQVWRFRPDRDVIIRTWRERADGCLLAGLREKRRRGDLDLGDIHKAFSSGRLFQWMDDDERVEQENQLIEWWFWEVYIPRLYRLATSGVRGINYSEVAKQTVSGLGEWGGSAHADLMTARVFAVAYLCERFGEMAAAARRKGSGVPDEDMRDEALKAYQKGSVTPQEAAEMDTSNTLTIPDVTAGARSEKDLYAEWLRNFESKLKWILGPGFTP